MSLSEPMYLGWSYGGGEWSYSGAQHAREFARPDLTVKKYLAWPKQADGSTVFTVLSTMSIVLCVVCGISWYLRFTLGWDREFRRLGLARSMRSVTAWADPRSAEQQQDAAEARSATPWSPDDSGRSHDSDEQPVEADAEAVPPEVSVRIQETRNREASG